MSTIAERAADFIRRRIFKDICVHAPDAPPEEAAMAMDAYLRHVAQCPFVAPDTAPCACSYDRKRHELHFSGSRGLLAVLSHNGLETAAEWNGRIEAEKADHARACAYLAEKGEAMPSEPPSQRSDSA